MVAELVKLVYSAWMIQNTVVSPSSFEDDSDGEGRQRVPSSTLSEQLVYLAKTSKKMMVLALIYGAMNILSFVSLRNISAGMFTIFSQTKILTTATFSSIMLRRHYSWTKWRALIALMFGVLLSLEPIWNAKDSSLLSGDGNPVLGITAVIIEVSLSGFASIYFEKVIKTDPQKLSIWERNFQLALGSLPVYMLFIVGEGGGTVGFFGGWSPMAVVLSILGAAGGLLVALSIKYGDSILKTLATTGAIVLTGILDYMFLKGPMTPPMAIAGVQVILAICNYTFDATPSGSDTLSPPSKPDHNNTIVVAESAPRELVRVNSRTNLTESSLQRV
jgi:UDP-sugar transporter A1/2/3